MVKFCINTEDFDRSIASGLIWELKDLIACNFNSVNLGFTMDTVFHLVFTTWLPKIWLRLICNGEVFHVKKNHGLTMNVKIAVIPYPSHSKFVEQILNMAKSW